MSAYSTSTPPSSWTQALSYVHPNPQRTTGPPRSANLPAAPTSTFILISPQQQTRSPSSSSTLIPISPSHCHCPTPSSSCTAAASSPAFSSPYSASPRHLSSHSSRTPAAAPPSPSWSTPRHTHSQRFGYYPPHLSHTSPQQEEYQYLSSHHNQHQQRPHEQQQRPGQSTSLTLRKAQALRHLSSPAIADAPYQHQHQPHEKQAALGYGAPPPAGAAHWCSSSSSSSAGSVEYSPTSPTTSLSHLSLSPGAPGGPGPHRSRSRSHTMSSLPEAAAVASFAIAPTAPPNLSITTEVSGPGVGAEDDAGSGGRGKVRQREREGEAAVVMRPELRMHKCELCGKRFARPSSLKTHLNSHTGDKPHVCPDPSCARPFSVLSNMRRHMRLHARSASLSSPSLISPNPASPPSSPTAPASPLPAPEAAEAAPLSSLASPPRRTVSQSSSYTSLASLDSGVSEHSHSRLGSSRGTFHMPTPHQAHEPAYATAIASSSSSTRNSYTHQPQEPSYAPSIASSFPTTSSPVTPYSPTGGSAPGAGGFAWPPRRKDEWDAAGQGRWVPGR